MIAPTIPSQPLLEVGETLRKPEPLDGAAFERALYVRQLGEYFAALPSSMFFSVIGALMALAMLASTGDLTRGLYWFSYSVAVMMFRLYTMFKFRRATEDARASPVLRRLTLLSIALSGAQWGLIGSVLYPPVGLDSYRELFSVLVVVSYVGGAISPLAPIRGAHAVYTVLASVPLTLWIFFMRDGIHWLPGLMSAFFFLSAIYLGHKQHRAAVERLRLNLESEAFLADLDASKGLLGQQNNELKNRAEIIRRGQQEARRRADMLSSHLRRTLLPVIDCDARFCVTDLNEAAHAMLGYSLKEVYGNNLGEVLFPPDRRASISPFLEKLFRDQTATMIEMPAITKLGQRVPVRLYVTPIFSEDHAPIRVSVIVTEAYTALDYKGQDRRLSA